LVPVLGVEAAGADLLGQGQRPAGAAIIDADQFDAFGLQVFARMVAAEHAGAGHARSQQLAHLASYFAPTGSGRNLPSAAELRKRNPHHVASRFVARAPARYELAVSKLPETGKWLDCSTPTWWWTGARRKAAKPASSRSGSA